MLHLYRDAHFSKSQNNIERTLIIVFLNILDLDNLEMDIDTLVLDISIIFVDLIRLKSASKKAFNIVNILIIIIMINIIIRSFALTIKQIQISQYKDKYNLVVTL
jgi:hypothetical protein